MLYFFVNDDAMHNRLVVASAAASCEALADTFGSDFGSILGGSPVHPILFNRKLMAGVNGGMSFVGSLCGCLGAALVGVVFYGFSRDAHNTGIAVCCGIAGFYMDSILGMFCQFSGIHDGVVVNSPGEGVHSVGGMNLLSNSAVNTLSSAFAAALCFFLV